MPDTALGNTYWLGIGDTAVKDGPSHLWWGKVGNDPVGQKKI